MRNVTSRVFLTSLLTALSACSAATPAPTAAPPGAGALVTSDTAAAAAPADNPGAAPAPAASPTAGAGTTGGSAAVPGGIVPSGSSKEDAHWIQADDYFVAHRAFEKGWLTVDIAKMKEPAKPADKGEALFFVIEDGRDQRSAFFYRTRPAVQADLVLGNTLICFDRNKKDHVYRGPTSKDSARPGGWWMAKVTDLSDLGKGYAQLAGSYHCAPDALRAIVK